MVGIPAAFSTLANVGKLGKSLADTRGTLGKGMVGSTFRSKLGIGIAASEPLAARLPVHWKSLLYACIEPSIDSKEFFLRKAIGWALREYAWTAPDAVARYVRKNQQRLSGLSKREALKNAGKRRAGGSA